MAFRHIRIAARRTTMSQAAPEMVDASRPSQSATKLPFTLRLKAWWEGYDPVQYAAWLERKAGGAAEKQEESGPGPAPEPEPDPESEPESEPESAPVDETATSSAPADPLVPVDPWDKRRTAIAQYIWGEGYCGPGGPEHVISMSKLLALSPKQSLLEIGSNLGGPARTLAQKFGVWVSGYESSATLVEMGNQISYMKGLLKKAEIFHYDPNTIEEFDRRFDRALAKESLYQIENKAHLLTVVERHLKPGSLFLITDYVLADESWVATDEYRDWRDSEAERRRPYLATTDDLISMLKKVRFNIRVNEDVSEHYIELINESWKGADQVAAKVAEEEDGEELVRTLLREAEFWSRRVRLLKAGRIQVRRILASKKAEKPSMLSDW